MQIINCKYLHHIFIWKLKLFTIFANHLYWLATSGKEDSSFVFLVHLDSLLLEKLVDKILLAFSGYLGRLGDSHAAIWVLECAFLDIEQA